MTLAIPTFSYVVMNNSLHASKEWKNDVSTRINLLNLDVPYVPFLIKDIYKYIQSNDYESNCIKTVQTIGHLQYQDSIKIVDTSEEGVEFPVSLDELPPSEIYFQVPRDTYNNIWEYNVVRVYGTLIERECQIILSIKYIFEVKNVILCRKMLKTLSLLTRKDYHQYSCDEEIDKLIDTQWKKIKHL